jgi:NADP-dependent 3-hydroxy acid dehydrogenase YdfG
MSTRIPLAGRTVAITGAARGIGAATAEELVRRGALVLLGDLDATAVQQLATRLGDHAVAAPLDVTDQASYEAFLSVGERAFAKPLDALVNNAGVMWVGPFDEEPEAAARRMMDVNFFGVVRGTRLVLPAMRARRSGHVVTVTSLAARIGPPGEATYAATKHAVDGWITAVREELRGSGVDLTLVMPVVVDTPLAAGTSSGGMPRLQPQQVATAVADALQRPRFEVFVPERVALLSRAFGVLPQRARDLMTAKLVPDQVKVTDQAARAAYEQDEVLRQE